MKRAYLTRPAFIMFICAGALAFFIVLTATSNKYAIYVACVLGTMFYSVYFIPFWACQYPFPFSCTHFDSAQGALQLLLGQPERPSHSPFSPALDR